MSKAAVKSEQQKLYLTLWLFSVFAVYYGTLIPFEFHSDLDAALLKASRALEFPAPWSRRGGFSTPDIVQNILLFLPFGFFAYLSRARIALVLIGAVLLSTSAECLQLFTPKRVTSWLDLATNGFGALAGYLIAPRLLAGGRKLHGIALRAGVTDSVQSRLAIVLLGLAIIHHFHPFAFGLDIGKVWQQLKALPQTFYLTPERGDGLTVLHWVLASSVICATVRDHMKPHRCVLILSGIAVIAELCQFAIRAREPGFHDIIVATASISMGAFVALRVANRVRSRGGTVQQENALLSVFTLILFFLTAAWDTLYPFQLELHGGFTWLPFQQSYNRTTFTALSNAMELLFSGLAIAFVFGVCMPTKAAKITAAVLAIGGFALLESSQVWVVGRYAGTEDIIALTLGIWLGFRLIPGLLVIHPKKPDQRGPS